MHGYFSQDLVCQSVTIALVNFNQPVLKMSYKLHIDVDDGYFIIHICCLKRMFQNIFSMLNPQRSLLASCLTHGVMNQSHVNILHRYSYDTA